MKAGRRLRARAAEAEALPSGSPPGSEMGPKVIHGSAHLKAHVFMVSCVLHTDFTKVALPERLGPEV